MWLCGSSGESVFVCVWAQRKEIGDGARKAAGLWTRPEKEKYRESLCKPQFPDHKQFLHKCMTCIAKYKVIDFSWQHFTFSSLFHCHFYGLQTSLTHFVRCKSPKESLWSASGLWWNATSSECYSLTFSFQALQLQSRAKHPRGLGLRK